MRALVVLSLALGICGASRAAAQCNTNAKDKITTTMSPGTQLIATPLAPQFNAGASASVNYSVTISPAKGGTWFLCIASLSISFPSVNGYTKPVSDLEWSIDGTTWTGLSTTPTQVRTGSGTLTVVLMLRSRLSYALDAPLVNGTPATYGPVTFELQALF